MNANVAIVPTLDDASPRSIALLKAIGFDKLAPEQRELALNIANRYGLDPLLKQVVLIDGRVYLTRDGLIHIAHRSGVFDGIEVTLPVKTDGYWRATCSVFRRDMTRPFTYPGRYPASGGNQKYNEEMAIKVAEVAALRRAFDVSAPTVEERWEGAEEPEPAPDAPTGLAAIAAAKAAALRPPVEDAPGADDEPPPSNVPTTPTPDAGGPGTALTEPSASSATTLHLNAAEFQTRAALAGLSKDDIRAAGKAMFPDKPATDLTDVEWGSLLLSMTS